MSLAWYESRTAPSCSPANTSQTTFLPVCGAECFKQASLIFSIVNSSSSNPTWTNSLGPICEYFYALPVTSALSLCTTISSLFLLGSFGLHCLPVLFSFIAFLNFFHLSALSAIFVYPWPQVILVYGNDRPWRFLFHFTFIFFYFIFYYFLLLIGTLLNLFVLIK